MDEERKEEILQKFSEVLFYLWDPLNMRWTTWPRNEYDSYIDKMLKMLAAGKDAAALEKHLARLVTRQMGMENNEDQKTRNRKSAALLYAVYHDFFESDMVILEVD